MTAGLRHLARERILKHVLVGFALCILVLGFTESAIYALLDAFDRPATFVSVIVAVQGVGAVLGGLATSALVKRVGEVAACVGRSGAAGRRGLRHGPDPPHRRRVR